MDKSSRIYIAGNKGMVGSAVQRLLESKGFLNILTVSKNELDLRNQNSVREFFEVSKPEYVVLAAAKVGGINVNMKYPAEFLLDNLMIQNNVIHNSFLMNIKKLIFLGSSCIYPKNSLQPMKEDCLMTGELEPTNEGYALAKITGLKLCEYYKREFGLDSITLIPPNLYGPNDCFDLEKSHVLSALVKRFVDAKKNKKDLLSLWGSGFARREFMHVNDCAEAILYFLGNNTPFNYINVGWGKDISIKELAGNIANKVVYHGEIQWDTSKPDGMIRKCMDVSLMKKFGFYPKISINDGVNEMISIYQEITS